jgi:hypothetical protein
MLIVMVDTLVTIIVGVTSSIASGVLIFVIERSISNRRMSERDMLWIWHNTFDRPAFRSYFVWESAMPPFIDALDGLIRLLKTGSTAKDRDPDPRYVKASIKNKDRHERVQGIVDRLSNVKSIITKTQATEDAYREEIRRDPSRSELLTEIDKIRKDRQKEIDSERDKIIVELNKILSEVEIPPLPLPSETGTKV